MVKKESALRIPAGSPRKILRLVQLLIYQHARIHSWSPVTSALQNDAGKVVVIRRPVFTRSSMHDPIIAGDQSLAQEVIVVAPDSASALTPGQPDLHSCGAHNFSGSVPFCSALKIECACKASEPLSPSRLALHQIV